MKKWIAGLMLVFSVVLFSISLYFLMGMFRQDCDEQQAYEELREIYENPKPDVLPDRQEEGETLNETVAVVDAGLLALHEKNPDCVGWLRIEGTVIDYPVMYRPQEKNYYLRRDFGGAYAVRGSLFLSEVCDPESSDNLIIYGHHMNSGTMFAALDNYKDGEFYKEHPKIHYSTLHGDEVYQVIAVFATPVYTDNDFEYYNFVKAETEKEYQDFVSACKAKSIYETGYSAVYGDRLMTLSTCEYSQRNGRMVVVAKRIEEQGVAAWQE